MNMVEMIRQRADEITKYLPGHVNKDRFIQTVLSSVSADQKLQSCDISNLLSEIAKAAGDGLYLDSSEAYLSCFTDRNTGRGVAKYMQMTQGLLKKVRNSGELGNIHAGLVYNGDELQYWVDEKGPHLKHQPDMTTVREDSNITHAYAVAITKDGASYIEIMPKKEIEKVRSISRRATKGPWVQWYGEMAKKSVIRKLSKTLPMSSDVANYMHQDDDDYEPDKVDSQEPKVDKEAPPSRMHAAVAAVTELTQQGQDQGQYEEPPTAKEAVRTGIGSLDAELVPNATKQEIVDHFLPPVTPPAEEPVVMPDNSGLPEPPPAMPVPPDLTNLSNAVMVNGVNDFRTAPDNSWTLWKIKVKGEHREAELQTFDDSIARICDYAKDNVVPIKILHHTETKGQYTNIVMDYAVLEMPKVEPVEVPSQAQAELPI